jgi:hypothetical protein
MLSQRFVSLLFFVCFPFPMPLVHSQLLEGLLTQATQAALQLRRPGGRVLARKQQKTKNKETKNQVPASELC